MTIASHERIKLELRAQAVWQFPSFSREEVQVIVHVSRSPSDHFFCVGRSLVILNTSPLSFMRMFAPSWRIIVIGVSGGVNCCLPFADMGSSSTRNRITPFTPTIPAGKSRTCTTLAVPIPPQVAIMLDGVTSTGTTPYRLRSRSHHRRPAEAPSTGCCAPVSVKPRAGSQDQTNELRMLQIRVESHNSLGCTTVQHVRRQIMQLRKSISWQKEILGGRLRSVLRCWILTLSRTCPSCLQR